MRFSYLVTVTTNREQQKKLNIVSTYKRGIGIAFFVYYKVKIMDIKTTVQRYLINKPATLVDFPFDSVTEVYKVKGKMFALLGKDKSKHVEHEQASNNLIPYRLNLKCDPDEAQILRDIFPAITPGYHMVISYGLLQRFEGLKLKAFRSLESKETKRLKVHEIINVSTAM